jgi:putative RNA 2'-phosphotransferase
MNEKELISKGKHLAFLLRHDKEALDNGLIDHNGWRKVSELIKSQGYTKELLDGIVETNNKKRYEFNEDHTKIRARQGHSINVDVELTEAEPPKVLYHGTSTKALESIYKQGILKGERLYVHLSKDEETALKVGSRHGTPYVLVIDSEQMYKDGIKFYLSNNGVWLTDYVDVKYITLNI